MKDLIPTTVVGSYPQPHWLIDREALGGKVPRVRSPEIWRIAPAFLEQAQDDATLLAIRDMERAGIDIITDGEIRRESYSNRFATALEGIDIEHPGTTINRSGQPIPNPHGREDTLCPLCQGDRAIVIAGLLRHRERHCLDHTNA